MGLQPVGICSIRKYFAWGIPLALLAGAAATSLLLSHLHLHNPRLQYGMHHMPAAFLQAALLTAIAGAMLLLLPKSASLEEKPASFYLLAVVVAFCLCWLPVLLSGRFVQDDWLLLLAGSIRKIIYFHPSYAWFSLDTVDGNFRPLGTTLYFAYMFKFFGTRAFAFLCGNFVVNLLGSMVAFFIVRQLGYGKVAAAAASLLYMTRGLNYTENAWVAALGDATVILLGALTVLLILRANRRHGASAFAHHAVAWFLFCVALFAKQSAFSIPLIVTLLVLIRPGETDLLPLRRRVRDAILIFVAYLMPTILIFLHAKALLRQQTPYPISVTLDSFTQWLCYIPWYFVAMSFPGKYRILTDLTKVAGAAILIGGLIFIARTPRVLGKRPRDIAFLLLATAAAIGPFLLLPTRTAPYYGDMAAFWASIALAIALTRFGEITDKGASAQRAYFALYLILVIGIVDIRVKQTGLIPSGGYIWGTYGMDREKGEYDQMARILAQSPDTRTVVLVDFPEDGRFGPAMAFLADARLRTVLTYDTATGTYRVNDLEGAPPKDGFGDLNDAAAYDWSVPLQFEDAARDTSQDRTVWIKFDNGKVYSTSPALSQAK